jgi:hypothetical protein
MTNDHTVGWSLFKELDARAMEIEASTGDMLDVAAVILATYMLRLRDELAQRQAEADIDLACWETLKARARSMVVYLEPVQHWSIH